MKKNIILMILLVLSIVLVSVKVNAEYRLLCLTRGETIEFSRCNSQIPDRTCDSDFGCQFCTNMIAENVYCPTSVNICNSEGLSCSYLENHTIDRQAPELQIIDPAQNQVYNSKSLIVNLDVDELADIYYLDNINGRGRWVRICTDCTSYVGRRSFEEGLNDLTFRASDPIGNEAFVNRSFFIDSKKPRISKTLPKGDFASGLFYIEFKEDNPSSIILNYGNPGTGYRNKLIDQENECATDRNKRYCTTNANLDDYDNEVIEYWFRIIDIADMMVDSRHLNLLVDTTEPILNSINFEVIGRSVNFDLGITEINFDSVQYYDNSEMRPRWRTLCNRLNEGHCITRKSFTGGIHNVDLKITDEAGNFIVQDISFTTS